MELVERALDFFCCLCANMPNSLHTYHALWALCYIGLVAVLGLLITLAVQYRTPVNSVYEIKV